MKSQRRAGRGFTLLELALALAIVGLLAALIVPRLGAVRRLGLESSARQLATRVRYLREEAALRGRSIRFAVDPARGTYGPAWLVETLEGARFVRDDAPLFRPVALPGEVAIELAGPGVVATAEGLLATFFAPDGYAEPAVIHLDDGRGGAFSIVIEPAVATPRLLDGRVELGEVLAP